MIWRKQYKEFQETLDIPNENRVTTLTAKELKWLKKQLDKYERIFKYQQKKIKELELANYEKHIEKEELLEKCREQDDDKTVALERIQKLENQILKMRTCNNCGNFKECELDYDADMPFGDGLCCKDFSSWVWEYENEREGE